MTTPTKRWLALATACFALTLLGWAVSSAEWSAHNAPIPKLKVDDDESGDSVSLPTGMSQSPGGDRVWLPKMPTWLVDALVALMYVLIAAVILAVVVHFVRRFLTTRPSGWDRVEDRAASQPDAGELRDALRAGLSDIDAGGDPRKAVIACWLRLERAAADVGVARLESETPSDLVGRVLSASRVDDGALSALVAAYHRARYAPHDVDAREREAAREALSRVDAQLAAATTVESA